MPWPNFNGHPSRLCSPGQGAYEIAEAQHAAWDRLSQAARRLHARNVHQVLGIELNDPARFVVCWTPGGCGGGGTGQAIRVARARGVPVLDLGAGCEETLQAIAVFLEQGNQGK